MTNLQLTSPQNLIRGEWVAAASTMAVHDPEDGSVIGRVPDGTDAMMLDAIAGAVDGADIARRLSVHERQTMLRRAADLVESRAETFSYTIACESSKTTRESRAEVRRAVDTLRRHCRAGDGRVGLDEPMPRRRHRFGSRIRGAACCPAWHSP